MAFHSREFQPNNIGLVYSVKYTWGSQSYYFVSGLTLRIKPLSKGLNTIEAYSEGGSPEKTQAL